MRYPSPGKTTIDSVVDDTCSDPDMTPENVAPIPTGSDESRNLVDVPGSEYWLP
jgi:hypothetical protein